jgi:hypothetical protein
MLGERLGEHDCALSSPGFVQRSASRSTRSFSAAEYRRRWAFAVTSVSCANGRPSVIVDILGSRLALYTKLLGVRCLIHVGREANIKKLVRARIVEERTGRKRDQVFVAMEIVRLMDKVSGRNT